MEGGVLRCDAGPSRFNNIAHTGDDLRQAVVVHGCKDDSLAKLVISGQYNPSALPVSVASESVSSPTPVATPQDGKSLLELLCGRTVSDEEFTNFQYGAEILIKGNWRSQPETDVPHGTNEKLTAQEVIPRLEVLLSTSKVDVKSVMEMTSMERPVVIQLLNANGYETYGVRQWIRKKTAA
jgi:hypothetical protein